MADEPERRRYYPDDDDVPLSQVVREAIEAHEESSLSADELAIYDHVNPEGIDLLFEDTTGVDVSVQIHLSNVTVSVWSDGGVEVRVSERRG